MGANVGARTESAHALGITAEGKHIFGTSPARGYRTNHDRKTRNKSQIARHSAASGVTELSLYCFHHHAPKEATDAAPLASTPIRSWIQIPYVKFHCHP